MGLRHGPNSYGRQQWGILHNGGNPDAATPRGGRRSSDCKLLAQRQFKAVRSILDVMNEVDIASLLSDLDDKELALAFRLIPKDKAAEVFANMNNSMQTYLVEMFSEKELKELLDDLYMDDTVDLLEELPANLVNRILNTVDQADRTLINQLLNYPDDSAGTLMTTEYVDIRETMTVAQAMAHIKETGIHKETIYTCYVTDQRRLLGIVSAQDLMTPAADVLIRDLMQTEIISVSTHTDKEEVAQLFTKYNFLALPVLDQDERLVGIVTFDDAMDVMVDEATEDITKMAAMSPSEKSYFETSVLAHAKHRIAWLLILMFSATITGTIITRYEILSLFFRQICCHMIGEEDAILVISLKPPAARSFISSSFVSVLFTKLTRQEAMMCGR